MRARRPIVACCLLAAGLLTAGSAVAGPNEDFAAVYSVWTFDGIPKCRFAKSQLVNAREQSKNVPDFVTYAPSFTGDVGLAIAYIDSGGCRGVARPPSKRKLAKSAVRAVKIGKVRPRGRESVVVTNSSRKAVNLAAATLRDRSGHRVRLGGKLGPRASRRVYSRGIWDDKGDVVKLVDRKGLVVRQTGYGGRAGVVRF